MLPETARFAAGSSSASLSTVAELGDSSRSRLCSPSRPIEAVKREAWQSQRILVVSKDHRRLDITEWQFIRRLIERHYGAKENRHG